MSAIRAEFQTRLLTSKRGGSATNVALIPDSPAGRASGRRGAATLELDSMNSKQCRGWFEPAEPYTSMRLVYLPDTTLLVYAFRPSECSAARVKYFDKKLEWDRPTPVDRSEMSPLGRRLHTLSGCDRRAAP